MHMQQARAFAPLLSDRVISKPLTLLQDSLHCGDGNDTYEHSPWLDGEGAVVVLLGIKNDETYEEINLASFYGVL